MLSITNLLRTVKLYNNPHYVSRYLSFIGARLTQKREKYKTHYHHILPKAIDFFPEYQSLKDFPWNGVHLTAREHFVAHLLLHKAFPGSSQSIAFFNMANICRNTSSRAYAEAREHQVRSLKQLHSSLTRNAKISATLRGKPKSAAHRQRMQGHAVSESTRQKLREANLGKKATVEARQKMSAAKKGKPKKPNSPDALERMRKTKLEKNYRWCNNGSEERLCSIIPDGWVYGKLTSTVSGRKHYNNGIVSKMFISPPDDSWHLGRLPFTRAKK